LFLQATHFGPKFSSIVSIAEFPPGFIGQQILVMKFLMDFSMILFAQFLVVSWNFSCKLTLLEVVLSLEWFLLASADE
jgi:hypothetical protein